MKKVFLLLLAFSLAMTAALPLAAEDREVVATGTAAGAGDKARDEALGRALRDAVEKAVGVLIEADTMVKNYQLLEDKIYSRVKGYVKSYDIISDNKGEGGMYEIKIKATVASDILQDDLAGLEVIKNAKGNPRIVILINEYVDGNESPSGTIRGSLEQEFLKRNFKLVDKNQLTAIKNRDVSVSYEDPQKAAALGARFGAEVVITGSANAEFMEKSKPYGVSVFAYSAESNLKAIKTDTAEVMAVASANSVQRKGGRSLAASEALADCSRQLTDKLIKDILEKWRSEVYNDIDMQLIISQADPSTRDRIFADLKETRGLKDVAEKSYTNNVLELDIKVDGAAAKVIDRKISERAPYLQLKSKTANRLDFEAGKAPAASALPTRQGSIIKAVETQAVEVSEPEEAAETPSEETAPEEAAETPSEEAAEEAASDENTGAEEPAEETQTQEEEEL